MLLLTANTTGRAWRATLNGRAYLVAPMTLLVPGVLNGSQGPLYYPPDEVAKGIDAWNGMPIVAPTHPVINGTPVSARSPQILDKYGIGFVFAARVDNTRLKAEGWFDELLCNRVDPGIVTMLEDGVPIELSTGLNVEKEPALPGSVHNAIPYYAVARNYRPDHLAVLTESIGACSLAHGCGVLVNQGQSGGVGQVVWTPLASVIPIGISGIYSIGCGNTNSGTPAGIPPTNCKSCGGSGCDCVYASPSITNLIPKNMPLEDVQDKVRSMFYEQHPMQMDTYGMWEESPWIVSVFKDYFIYRDKGDLYRQNFSMDKDGVVTLDSKVVEVEKVVRYVPVEQESNTLIQWGA